jgi:hypothetical protein
MHTAVTSVLTSHRRLPNPRDLEKNNEQFLKLGYAVDFLDQVIVPRSICDKIYYNQTVEVKITRKAIARDFDATGKGSIDKLLLEDRKLVYNELYKQDTAVTGIIQISDLNDSGIEYVYSDKMDFISTSITVEIEYNETLT